MNPFTIKHLPIVYQPIITVGLLPIENLTTDDASGKLEPNSSHHHFSGRNPHLSLVLERGNAGHACVTLCLMFKPEHSDVDG
jgi:hypothetical protein